MSATDPTVLLQPAATKVRDPVSGRSVWLAGMVRNPRMKGDGDMAFDLHFQAAHSPDDRRAIIEAIEANLRAEGFEGKVYALHAGEVPKARPRPQAKPRDPVPGMSGPGMQPHGGPIQKMKLEGVRHIVAVTSGKGGVGKSTVSTNLAVALQAEGLQVGLLDADIYGPSVPTMMNIHQRPMMEPQSKKILPISSYGVRCLSMGMLVDPEQAMIWRGPMVMSAVRQFLRDARWDGIDVLLIDMPPGTGDAQLTLIQAVDLSGAVIVTTPQPVALADAVRGISMFRKLEVPLLGLVENMAWYELPDGTRDHVFGEGGGVVTAQRYDTELLGQIPLRSAIRQGGDDGVPVALDDGPSGKAFQAIARRLVQKLEEQAAEAG